MIDDAYGAITPRYETDGEKVLFQSDEKDIEIAKLKRIIETLRRLNPNIEKAFQEGIECERRRWEMALEDLKNKI